MYLSATSLQHLPLCYNNPAAFTSLLQQACSIYLSVTTSRQHLPLCYIKQALFTPLLHQTCSNYPSVTTNRQHLPLCYNKPAAFTRTRLLQTFNIFHTDIPCNISYYEQHFQLCFNFYYSYFHTSCNIANYHLPILIPSSMFPTLVLYLQLLLSCYLLKHLPF